MDVSTIHQTAVVHATPEEVYKALTNTRMYSRFTGSAAEIGRRVGDPFSAYDGYIEGMNLELAPGKRIVRSWRAKEAGWPEDHYSQVSWSLHPVDHGTKVVLHHERVPSELAESFKQGWKDYYWAPLRALFQHN